MNVLLYSFYWFLLPICDALEGTSIHKWVASAATAASFTLTPIFPASASEPLLSVHTDLPGLYQHAKDNQPQLGSILKEFQTPTRHLVDFCRPYVQLQTPKPSSTWLVRQAQALVRGELNLEINGIPIVTTIESSAGEVAVEVDSAPASLVVYANSDALPKIPVLPPMAPLPTSSAVTIKSTVQPTAQPWWTQSAWDRYWNDEIWKVANDFALSRLDVVRDLFWGIIAAYLLSYATYTRELAQEAAAAQARQQAVQQKKEQKAAAAASMDVKDVASQKTVMKTKKATLKVTVDQQPIQRAQKNDPDLDRARAAVDAMKTEPTMTRVTNEATPATISTPKSPLWRRVVKKVLMPWRKFESLA